MVDQDGRDSNFLGEQPFERVRVLVVDDNRDIVRTCSVLLQYAGFEVQAASNGHDALERASAFHPLIALLDLGLPDLNGCEIARRLRADPTLGMITLIAITAYDTEDERRLAEAVGFDHYLVKPAPFHKILSLIEAHSPRSAPPDRERKKMYARSDR
jgi:DNA-binding response OmpR family regulator